MQRHILLAFAISFISFRTAAQSDTLSPKIISYIDNTSLNVRDVHTDCAGNIVYVGGTASNAFICTPGTASTGYNGGNCDAFVLKLDSNGLVLWSTLLGGNKYDRAYAVEIDDQGFIYVAGRAGNNFPTTPCVLQESFAGDNDVNSAYGAQDGFITKLSPNGQLIWSTYVGGSGRGFIRDIDLDSEGNIWAGMSTISNTFPHITGNAVQSTSVAGRNSGLVKVSPDGSILEYGSFLSPDVSTGAGPTVIRVDRQDNVVLLSTAGGDGQLPITAGVFQPIRSGGNDFVVSKFDSAGKLLFCSFLGGSDLEEIETHSLEIMSTGDIVVAAYTKSTDYPVTAGAFQGNYAGGELDGVVTRISSDGSAILASTYIGGANRDEIEGIGLDPSDHIFLTGGSISTNFPVTPDAYQLTLAGNNDGILVMLSPDLSSIYYATYIGGTGVDKLRTCHVDDQGKAYGAGQTGSSNLPTLNAFDPALTGNNTGMAVVFNPEVFFVPVSGCALKTDTFFSPITSIPTAAFSDSVSGPEVHFTAAQSIGGGLYYAWDFGDSGQDSGQNPTHTYATSGVYTVCLIVRNSCGSDTTCHDVLVNPASETVETGADPAQIFIYPNPTDRLLSISTASNQSEVQYLIRLCDFSGKAIISSSITFKNGKTRDLDLQGTTSGIYFLQLLDEHGRLVEARKIIKIN